MDGVVETICIRILRRCNLQCAHCWAESSPGGKDELSANVIRDFLERMKKIGLRHVSVSGGEPSLHSELADIIESATELGLYVTVTTNGTRQERLLNAIDKLEPSALGHLRVRVSIDGGPSYHNAIRGNGTYALALECVREIRETIGWVGVNTIITPNAEQLLEHLVEALNDARVDEMALMSLVPWLRVPNATLQQATIVDALQNQGQVVRALGFKGRVTLWDFVSHPEGGLEVQRRWTNNNAVHAQAKGTICWKYRANHSRGYSCRGAGKTFR